VDQSGNIAGDPQSRAFLNLGPSLGQRTIPLSGSLHASINFNDAFDGGHLGDVRITLPPDPGATLSTTAVPLLTNPNVTNNNTDAPNDEINTFVLIPAIAPTTFQLTLANGPEQTPDITYGAAASACASATLATPSTTWAPACLQFAHDMRDAIGQTNAAENSARNVYVVAVPYAVATQNNSNAGRVAVHVLFAGTRNEEVVGGFDGTATCAALGPPLSATPGCTRLTSSPAFPGSAIVMIKPFASGTSTIQVAAHQHTTDAQDMGGCGDWDGNGAGATPPTEVQDVDLPANVQGLNKTGNDNYVGSGSVSPDPDAGPGDVVLRTSALKLNVAAPNTVTVPGDNEDNPGSTLNTAYTAGGLSIQVPPQDAAAFSPGQTLTITDGFNSDTTTIGTSSSDVDGTTGNINIQTGLANDYAQGSLVSVNGDAVVSKSVGTSGGRANLFGQPINGLAKGNSVDVTVNLATDIHSIARQVDAATPPPFGGPSVTTGLTGAAAAGATTLSVTSTTGIVAGEITVRGVSGTVRGVVTTASGGTINLAAPGLSGAAPAGGTVSQTPEVKGNINAYSDCRQAWTGSIRNYLTGIKLVGSLRISPAITADGKVRIAKVNLRTPAPIPQALAACLTPYQLYMEGTPLAGDPFFTVPNVAPQLIFGAEFNPLVVLAGSSTGISAKPNVGCNANGGPLARSPFNAYPNGGTGLKDMLENGAAVGVSGTIATAIKAEVLVGSF
jgi:hypothetical protein